MRRNASPTSLTHNTNRCHAGVTQCVTLRGMLVPMLVGEIVRGRDAAVEAPTDGFTAFSPTCSGRACLGKCRVT